MYDNLPSSQYQTTLCIISTGDSLHTATDKLAGAERVKLRNFCYQKFVVLSFCIVLSCTMLCIAFYCCNVHVLYTNTCIVLLIIYCIQPACEY